MAPASDYIYLSIQTVINTVSLIVVVPCIATLIRTQGIHGNCKILLVCSAFVQILILCTQAALFGYNYITENLMPLTIETQRPFELVQNALFTMSSYLSLVIVMERIYAVRHAAEYEKTGRHIIALMLLITGCLLLSLLAVYVIHMYDWFYPTIAMLYAVEACTLIISIIIIVYARRKMQNIPFDADRLNAMYQLKEVLAFSVAILPSMIISSIMHTLSLIPTLLWINGVMEYPLCCLVYFSVQSLNCVLTKFVLIMCHNGMRQRFHQFFVKAVTTPQIITRDTEQEGKAYFEQIRSAWDNIPQ